MVCHGLFIAIMAGIGLWLKLGVAYFVGLTLACGMILHQYQLIKTRDRDKCFAAFQNNNWVGMAIFAGLSLDLYHRIRIF